MLLLFRRWQQTLEELSRIVGMLLVMMALFMAFVVIENYVRVRQRKAIPVSFEGHEKAKVTAYVWPDFLWIGNAWYVDIECDHPVSIDFDGEWKASLPRGTTTIYSNHDSNNTAKFGAASWYATPKVIVVKDDLPL